MSVWYVQMNGERTVPSGLELDPESAKVVTLNVPRSFRWPSQPYTVTREVYVEADTYEEAQRRALRVFHGKDV